MEVFSALVDGTSQPSSASQWLARSSILDDLEAFCAVLAERAERRSGDGER